MCMFFLMKYRYGQFSPDAIVDGRYRIINFHLDNNNGSVTAIVPHFWQEMGTVLPLASLSLSPSLLRLPIVLFELTCYTTDLDPTYSVLVGKSKDSCRHHNGVNKNVYIGVFVTIGVPPLPFSFPLISRPSPALPLPMFPFPLDYFQRSSNVFEQVSLLS